MLGAKKFRGEKKFYFLHLYSNGNFDVWWQNELFPETDSRDWKADGALNRVATDWNFLFFFNPFVLLHVLWLQNASSTVFNSSQFICIDTSIQFFSCLEFLNRKFNLLPLTTVQLGGYEKEITPRCEIKTYPCWICHFLYQKDQNAYFVRSTGLLLK